MQKKIIIKTTDDKNISGILNTTINKSKGLIIFVHGLTGSQNENIFVNGTKYFESKGYSSYRFNLYGKKGNIRKLEETSLKDHIIDVNKIVSYFQKKGIEKIFLVGHSFGGLTILYSDLSGISAVVLWDSSIGGDELLGDVFYDKVKKKYFIDWGDGFKHFISKNMYKDFCIDPRYNVKRIKEIKLPIKIICAENGLKKPAEKYYKEANTPKDFSVIVGATHCFEEKGTKKELFDETFKWIKKY